MALESTFIHHVFFWLNNPEDKQDLQNLLDGLQKLTAITTIRQFHIGEPAKTNRGVVERSYSVSWLAIFDNATDQDSYQVDPIHLKFVEECSRLWQKVIVYDSMQAK